MRESRRKAISINVEGSVRSSNERFRFGEPNTGCKRRIIKRYFEKRSQRDPTVFIIVFFHYFRKDNPPVHARNLAR